MGNKPSMTAAQARAKYLAEKNNTSSANTGKRTTMSAAEAREKYLAEEGRGSAVGGVDTANAWIDRYNAAIKGVSEYDTSRGTRYTSDVSGGYGVEIDKLVSEYDANRSLFDGFELQSAYEQLKELQGLIQEGNAVMKSYGNAKSYYDAQVEDRELQAQREEAERHRGVTRDGETVQKDLDAVNDQLQAIYKENPAFKSEQGLENYQALLEAGYELPENTMQALQYMQNLEQRRKELEDEQGWAQYFAEEKYLLDSMDWAEKYAGQSYDQLMGEAANAQTAGDAQRAQWLTDYAKSVMTAEDKRGVVQENEKTIQSLENEVAILQTVLVQYDDARYGAEGGSPDAKARLAQIQSQFGTDAEIRKKVSDMQTRIIELKNESWQYENDIAYAFLEENEDFGEKSGYVTTARDVKWWENVVDPYNPGYGDLMYEYINNQPGVRNAILKYFSSNYNEGDDGNIIALQKFNLMEPEEVKKYNYLYATQGRDAASKYLDYLSYELNARATANLENEAHEMAQGVGGGIVSSALSVPINLVSGVGLIDASMQKLQNSIREQTTGEYRPVDYNTDAMAASKVSSTIRGTVGGNIANATGTINMDPNKYPTLSRLLNGKSLGDVYQLGMSMADSAAVAAMAPVLGGAGTVLLGGSAGTQGMLDAVANGANDEQAIAMGVLNGAFEMVFEKVSIDKLLDGSSGNIVKDILTQGITEGSEEAFTSIANTVADIVVMAEKSDWQKNIAAYMEQGMTEEEAKKEAFLDAAIQIGWDFVGGMASGGITGGGKVAIDSAKAKATEAKLNKVLETIKSQANGNQVAEQAQQPAVDIDPDSFQAQVQAQVESHWRGDENVQTDPVQTQQTAVDIDPNSPQGQIIRNMTGEDVQAQPVGTREQQEQIERLSKVTGRKVELYQGAKYENGYFDRDTGTIYVNVNGADPVVQTFVHELTHSTEGAKVYNGLKAYVFGKLGQSGKNLAQMKAEKIRLYESRGKQLDSIGAEQEIVAEYVSQYLLTDEQTIMEVCRSKPTLGRQILNWLGRFLAKLGVGKADRAALEHAKILYAKALNQTQSSFGTQTSHAKPVARNANRQAAADDTAGWTEMLAFRDRIQQELEAGKITDEEYDQYNDMADNWEQELLGRSGADVQHSISSDVQYSIAVTTDGRKVAVVDSDILEEIYDGVWNITKKRQAQAEAKRVLLKFKDGISVDGVEYAVNRTSRREYTRSNDTDRLYRKDKDAFADKMRMANNVDDVIIATTDWKQDGGLNYPREDNFVDFVKGDTLMMSGDAKYTAKVVVGIEDSGRKVFYDVEDISPTDFTIKETEPSSTATTNKSVGDILEGSVEKTLSQDGADVKQYSISDTSSKQDVVDGLKDILRRGGDINELRQFVAQVERNTPKTERNTREAERILRLAKQQGISVEEYLSQNWELYETENGWDPAARKALELEKGDGRQYSIAQLPDGKKYVRADRQVIFGNDPESWSEQVEDYINGRIRRGQDISLIAEDGEVLTITSKTAGKLADNHTSKGTTMSDDAFYLKANAAVHIDELAQVSEAVPGVLREDVDGRHGAFASGGWSYRTAYFQDFDGKYYRLRISAAKNADGTIVYNIGDVKERSFPTINGSSVTDGALGGKTSSEKTLPQKSTGVKQFSITDTQAEPAETESSEKENWGDDVPRSNFFDRVGSKEDGISEEIAFERGYPVIDGVQVIPHRTWVLCEDPKVDEYGYVITDADGNVLYNENYGLVTGIVDTRKLLVSFRNKTGVKNTIRGSKRDNRAIETKWLTPVPAQYQMTPEEYNSLDNAEPMNQEDIPMEDLAEIEEMRSRAEGTPEEPVEITPVNREDMNKRAARHLERAERMLLNKLKSILGCNRFTDISNVENVVTAIADEYLETGTVKDESLEKLFNAAYDNAILIDRDFYDTYKEVKGYLRTTAVTLSERDRLNIADWQDFKKRAFGNLRIVNEGGLPVDTAYGELHTMAPNLFPESIVHPADQLVQMYEVAKSIAISEKNLNDYHGNNKDEFRFYAKNDFDCAVWDSVAELRAAREYTLEQAQKKAEQEARKNLTIKELMDTFEQLKKARKNYEKVVTKNLLSNRGEMQVGRLLRGEILPEHLDESKDNVNGILAVYEAKREYERLCGIIGEHKRHRKGELRQLADSYLKNASEWVDKKIGLLYSRETMRRNIQDIVKDQKEAAAINAEFFDPVQVAEAAATRFKTEYRDRVRALNLSTKKRKGDAVSEAHAVQLLGEVMDNIEVLENARGMLRQKDGKTLAEWRAVVDKLWQESPSLDKAKIEGAVRAFRNIYDQLFQQMNEVRVRNGYEPVSYRRGYFPHFQPGGDGIIAQFGKVLGINTEVNGLPTTINGLTHNFRPGIQWFGNAQERLGFNTAYDAVEGFDKYIEGVASVIHQTDNIQKLRALAAQVRYRTTNEGIRQQVDEVLADTRLTEEEKQAKINDIYEHGKFSLSHFVVELDEYTNLLANKKSRLDRTVEGLMGRKAYTVMKNIESRVGANMIAGNLGSALTNFIPLTQASAQLDRFSLLRGMWSAVQSYRKDDGIVGMSTFLTNRRGSDPLVRTWAEKASGVLSKPMELIDTFVSDSIVRGAYFQNLRRGLSEAEAMHQADIFAAGVIADRSKGSMPTLFESTNPIFKAFTQFQLEVNNQFSEVFKDLPRNHGKKGAAMLALVLLKYFLGAWLFDEAYEYFVGRRPALDPIDLLNSTVGDLTGYELPNILELGEGLITGEMPSFETEKVGFGEAMTNLGTGMLEELPFSAGLGMFGAELDGGRIPVSSAIPDLSALWDAATDTEMSGKKRWKETQDELNKLAYMLPPFGGNQVSKIWKGIKAYVEGGSYNVDNEGNDVLQYPVYKDDPQDAFWSLVRAALMGKSSLPEAQEWVDSGFDSFSAKQTAIYQDLLDAGVEDREAYGVLREFEDVTKTPTESKETRQRKFLRDSDLSDDGKAIIYYGMLASDKDQLLMDKLTDMGADPSEAAFTLMDIQDAEDPAAVRDVIAGAALTDQEKVELYRAKVSDKQDADIAALSAVGLGFDDYLEVYGKRNDLKNDKSVGNKALEFSYWVDSQGFSEKQADAIKACFGDDDAYEKYVEKGLDPDMAYELADEFDDLEPMAGKKSVAALQKWRVCVDFSDNVEDQMTALYAVMSATEYQKVEIANGFGVTPRAYVSLEEVLPQYDADGNGSFKQAEITAAIDSLDYSDDVKAVLWQMTVGKNTKWKNNPYSQKIGQQVYEARQAAPKVTDEEGSTLADDFSAAIAKQWE